MREDTARVKQRQKPRGGKLAISVSQPLRREGDGQLAIATSFSPTANPTPDPELVRKILATLDAALRFIAPCPQPLNANIVYAANDW